MRRFQPQHGGSIRPPRGGEGGGGGGGGQGWKPRGGTGGGGGWRGGGVASEAGAVLCQSLWGSEPPSSGLKEA